MKWIYALPVLAVCLSSCEREMTLDANERPSVVVDCVLTTDPSQTLHLSFTKGASREEFGLVGEATAVLYDDTDRLEAGRFEKAEDGVWTLDYAAKENHKYVLRVLVPGYDEITATQRMPEPPAVSARRGDCDGHIVYFHNHSGEKVSLEYHVRLEPYELWIYAMNYDEAAGRRAVADHICCSVESADQTNLSDRLYEGEAYPELRGRRMHEKYLKIDLREYAATHPRAEYVYMTVAGEFLGEFPYSIEVTDSVYGGLRDNDHVTDDGVLKDPGDKDGYLVFSRLSEEYQKFLDEVQKFQEIQESTDMSTIYLRDNMYTNISGGLGIFGAEARRNMMWSRDTIPANSTTIYYDLPC